MPTRLFLTAAAASLSFLLPNARLYAQAQITPVESHAYFAKGAAVSVPLEIKGGIPFIKAMVNGKPVTMTLDNVWNTDVLTTIAAQRLGVISADPSIGGQTATSGVVNRLQIGSFVLESDPITIVPSEGWPDDGLLGTGLFQKVILRLDYRAGLATIYDPTTYQPSEKAVALPLTILNGGRALVEATVDGVTGRFDLRAGDWPALKLDANFIAREHLRDTYREGIRVDSQVDHIRIEKLDLGAYRIADLTVEMPKESPYDKDKSRASDGQIGNDLLQNFVVTFDYPHRRFYLESPDKSIRRVQDIEAADLAVSHVNDRPDMVDGQREMRNFHRRFSQIEFIQGVANAYKLLSLPELMVTIRPFNKVQGSLTQEMFLRLLRPEESEYASAGMPAIILPMLATINSSSVSLSALNEDVHVTPWRPDRVDVKPTEIVVISSPSIDTEASVVSRDTTAASNDKKRLRMKATFRSIYRRGGDCPTLSSIDLVGFAMSLDGKSIPDATVRDMFDPNLIKAIPPKPK